ncbi:hypothetical protein J2W97_001196 [Paenibacillus jamilae]|nr:hypothetical protein [Paenibacillus jamilae]
MKWQTTHKIIGSKDHKLCSICNGYFTLDNFYSNKANSIDGLSPYCKTCTKEKSNKWAKDNYDRRLEIKRNNNKAPNAMVNQRENTRRKRENGYYKDHYRKNFHKYKDYWKRRSKKKHDISEQEWKSCKDYFNDECAYCSLPANKHFILRNENLILMELHREHVDDKGANDLSNCIPSCRDCNSCKSTYSLSEWYDETNVNFSIERLKRIHNWLNEDYKKYLRT